MPCDQQCGQNEGRGDQQHTGEKPDRKSEERLCPRRHAPKSGPQPGQRMLLAGVDHAGHHGDVQHGADDDNARHHHRRGEPDRREQQEGDVLIGQRGLIGHADTQSENRRGERDNDRRQKQPVGEMCAPAAHESATPPASHRAPTEIAHPVLRPSTSAPRSGCRTSHPRLPPANAARGKL